MRSNCKSSAVLVFIAFFLFLGAARATPPVLEIARATRTPKLNDYLVDLPRDGETVIREFRQREPGDGVPISERTTSFISYDQKNLYVIFVCDDKPDQIRAHMAKREDIQSDDMVTLYLDTFHDRRRAYVFSVNPLGVQLDGIVTEGQSTDYSFDTLWYSEGRLTETGYAVSITIPFKSLRFSGEAMQSWGMALGRSISRKNEIAHWPFISTRVDGFVNQMATLGGMKDISRGRNVQLIPYGIAARARFLDESKSVPAFRSVTDTRFGLDAKVVLRDAFTLDVTANPDFSQVESDEPQVTVNQRFEVFFPEKRPFFLENAGFFRTPVNLFFSRRVVDPELGVRLTGKVGSWAIGAIAIDDRAPGKRVSEDNQLFGDHARIGVFRLQREFGRQSAVGVLATTRDFGPSSERVYSADTRLRLNPNWTFSGQAIVSETKLLNGIEKSGAGFLGQIAHTGRHLGYVARYTDFAPGFSSQIGFIQRVNTRRIENSIAYSWRPKTGKILSFGPTALFFRQRDHSGNLQDSFANFGFNAALPRQTAISSTAFKSVEVFGGTPFQKNGFNIILSSEWKKWLAIQAFVASRKAINYFPGPGIKPFLAEAKDANVSIVVRPRPQMQLSQTYIYTGLRTGDNALPAGVPASAAIFHNHILRSKFNYQFTRELSVRAIVDYNGVLSNPSLVNLDRTKRIRTDLLVTYLIHPGTALYVGYSDAHENVVIDPANPSGLRLTNSPTTTTGRQIFVKLSYLFRL